MTKHDVWAVILALVFLLALVLMPMPAKAAAQPFCYRTAKGIVCIQGQAQTGGSGITPVKRLHN